MKRNKKNINDEMLEFYTNSNSSTTGRKPKGLNDEMLEYFYSKNTSSPKEDGGNITYGTYYKPGRTTYRYSRSAQRLEDKINEENANRPEGEPAKLTPTLIAKQEIKSYNALRFNSVIFKELYVETPGSMVLNYVTFSDRFNKTLSETNERIKVLEEKITGTSPTNLLIKKITEEENDIDEPKPISLKQEIKKTKEMKPNRNCLELKVKRLEEELKELKELFKNK